MRGSTVLRWLLFALAVAAGASLFSGFAQKPYDTAHQYLPDPFGAAGRQHAAICPEHRTHALANGHRKLYRWNALVGDEGENRREVCGEIDYDNGAEPGSWTVSEAFDSNTGSWLVRAYLHAADDPAWQLSVACASRVSEFTGLGEESPFSDGLTSGRSLSISVIGPLQKETLKAVLRFEASSSIWEGEQESWTAKRVDHNGRGSLILHEQDGAGHLVAVLGNSTQEQPQTLEVVLQPGGQAVSFNSGNGIAAIVASECGRPEAALP